jgi:hypothetical protein
MAKTLKEVKFICTKCGAEDTGRFYPSETTPPAINCWKCHAGYQKSMEDMITRNIGMFPQVDA